MKTALIFGATGQSGSYLAELLLNKGYEVIGVARRSSTDTSSRLSAAKKYEMFQLVEGDVTDPLCVYRLIEEYVPSEIYQLAAQSHVGTSFQEPSHTFDVTTKGTLNVLEAIRTIREGGRVYAGFTKAGPRFYQASSSEMFGSAYSTRLVAVPRYVEHENEMSTVELFQNEATPMLPNSPYAVAKLAAHNLVRIYREAYGIHASSGILFNHESERRGENFVTRKISLWVAGLRASIRKQYPSVDIGCDAFSIVVKRQINEGVYPRLKLGNLEARRDWGHAADYVRGMWMMLQQDKPDDYVLATGETHSVREFLEEALKVIVAADVKAEEVVEQDATLLRPSEVPFLRGDASKARAKLSWEPTITFPKLVERMVLSDIANLKL